MNKISEAEDRLRKHRIVCRKIDEINMLLKRIARPSDGFYVSSSIDTKLMRDIVEKVKKSCLTHLAAFEKEKENLENL